MIMKRPERKPEEQEKIDRLSIKINRAKKKTVKILLVAFILAFIFVRPVRGFVYMMLFTNMKISATFFAAGIFGYLIARK